MKETDIEITEKTTKKRFLATVARFLPFEFTTLQEVPRPTWTLLFVIVFFCLLWRGYARNFDASKEVESQLAGFVNRERGNNPEKPIVLIGGSSMNRMGIHEEIFRTRIGVSTGKTPLSSGTPWELHKILAKYPEETSEVRVVVCDFDMARLISRTGRKFEDRYFLMKEIGDWKYPSEAISVDYYKALFPARQSVRFIGESMSTSYTDNFWKSSFYKKRKASNHKTIQRILAAKNRGKPTNMAKGVFEYGTSEIRLDTEMVEAVRRFVDFCHSRNIFIIFNITPRWRGFEKLPISDRLNEHERRYLDLLEEFASLPHCQVVAARNFAEIDSKLEEEPLFFDTMHMTLEGATIYTNWFASRILKDPKIVAALKTPKEPKEFIVSKHVKRGYWKLVGYFKPKTAAEDPVMVASPSSATTR